MSDTTVPRHDRRFAIQWRPNFMRGQSRLVLTRVYWNKGNPGDGKGYSAKVSVSLCWAWRNMWIGASVKPELWGFILYICLLPCLPIRIHLKRAYGGRLF